MNECDGCENEEYLVDTRNIPDMDNLRVRLDIMGEIETFFQDIYFQGVTEWNHNAWPHIGVGDSGALVGHARDFSSVHKTTITFKEMQQLSGVTDEANNNLKKTFNATEEFKEELL